MPVSRTAAGEVATDLVLVFKRMAALKLVAPQFHPDVEQSAYPALLTLDQGPARVSTIAAQIHSDISTVSRQVSHLCSVGLAAKVADPDDRRAQMVQLTDAGTEAVTTIRDARAAWLQEVLADWTSEDARALSTNLRRFADALDTALTRHHDTPRKDHP